MLIIDLTVFMVACLVLVYSNNFVVKSLAKISSFLRLSEFTIGFILVAVATSIPETFVGVMSALNKTPALSVGTVIGANLLDITLIIGIGALIAKNIQIESKIVMKDLLYMLVITIIPVVLLLDHHIWKAFGLFPNMVEGLSRVDGLLLLCVFAYYMYSLIQQESKFSKQIEPTSRKEAAKSMLIFLASITLLLVSANFVVGYAEKISIDLAVPPLLIGLFLISVGTTLPELMFTIRTVQTEHQSMAVGDVVGSVITNSTLVLGLTALIHPVTINTLVYFTSTLFMLFSAFIFFTFAESDSGISRREGIALILLYVLFLIIETYMKTARL